MTDFRHSTTWGHMPNRNAFTHQITAVLGGLMNQQACDSTQPKQMALSQEQKHLIHFNAFGNTHFSSHLIMMNLPIHIIPMGNQFQISCWCLVCMCMCVWGGCGMRNVRIYVCICIYTCIQHSYVCKLRHLLLVHLSETCGIDSANFLEERVSVSW